MDPEGFARYATIQDVLQGAHGNKKVRVIGKFLFVLLILRSDNHATQMRVAHAGSEIDCSVPDTFQGHLETGQLVQVFGTVIPVFFLFFFSHPVCTSSETRDFVHPTNERRR
jgi:hypothetical protein